MGRQGEGDVVEVLRGGRSNYGLTGANPFCVIEWEMEKVGIYERRGWGDSWR